MRGGPIKQEERHRLWEARDQAATACCRTGTAAHCNNFITKLDAARPVQEKGEARLPAAWP